MVQGWGTVHCTTTVVLPHARLPGGSEGSRAAHAGRLARASIAPGMISTWPGRPAVCILRKCVTEAWMSPGSCFPLDDASAATGASMRTRRNRQGANDEYRERVTGMMISPVFPRIEVSRGDMEEILITS